MPPLVNSINYDPWWSNHLKLAILRYTPLLVPLMNLWYPYEISPWSFMGFDPWNPHDLTPRAFQPTIDGEILTTFMEDMWKNPMIFPYSDMAREKKTMVFLWFPHFSPWNSPWNPTSETPLAPREASHRSHQIVQHDETSFLDMPNTSIQLWFYTTNIDIT